MPTKVTDPDVSPDVARRLDDLAARWPRYTRVRHRDTGRRGTVSFDYDAPGYSRGDRPSHAVVGLVDAVAVEWDDPAMPLPDWTDVAYLMRVRERRHPK